MPYSDNPPPLVWPDTQEGHWDAMNLDPAHEVAHVFCDLYRLDRHPMNTPGMGVKNPCKNRRFEGDRSHNWCHRCFAGFPTLTYEALETFDGAFSKTLSL